MGVNQAIDLPAEHRKIVLELIERYLPATPAWVYGSRVKWTSRLQADLDLVVFATPEQRRQVGDLREAFEEANLPFRVDLFVWDDVPESFRKQIETDHAVLVAEGARQPLAAPCLPTADKWLDTTINAIAASSPNAIVGGPFGSNLVSRDYVSEGVPVIRGQNMGARWVTGDFVFVTPEKADSLKANLVQPGDIVLTQRGTLGQVSIVPSALLRCLLSQSQMKVSVDPDVADPLFLYYVLLSPEQQDYVLQNAIQTGVPHTNLGILRSTPITVPPLREQLAISHVLGTLDDRIELNRRMNGTLEAMVRELFRSWFIDFDPVRAKVDGRDTGLPKDIADLFPDRLVDSKQGEIPEGWTPGTLGDIVSLNPESWETGNPPQSVEYVDLTSTKWGYIERVESYQWEQAPSRARRVLRKGDTIVATVRPGNGSFALVDEDGLTGSTGFATLRPRNFHDRELVWCAATSSDNIDRLAHLADGGAYPAVRPAAVLATPLVLADSGARRAFALSTARLLNRIETNKRASHVLASLRDALLPRLVAGDLRMPVTNRPCGDRCDG